MVSKEFLPNKMKRFETNCRSKVASKKNFSRSKLSIIPMLIKSELSSSLSPPFLHFFLPWDQMFPYNIHRRKMSYTLPLKARKRLF
jgi:hypothetical protein